MLNFNSVLIGSDDPKRLISFYSKVLDKKGEWGEGQWGGFLVCHGFIIIGPHSEIKGQNPQPGRMLINFETADVAGELKRIKKTGAKVIAEPYHPEQEMDMWIA